MNHAIILTRIYSVGSTSEGRVTGVLCTDLTAFDRSSGIASVVGLQYCMVSFWINHARALRLSACVLWFFLWMVVFAVPSDFCFTRPNGPLLSRPNRCCCPLPNGYFFPVSTDCCFSRSNGSVFFSS